LAGELLKKAEELLDMEIHPTVLAKGYNLAAEKSQQLLKEMAEHIVNTDTQVLKKIAVTAMNGKGAEIAKEKLSDVAVRAIVKISETIDDQQLGGERILDPANTDFIKIEKKVGAGVDNTSLIEGIILDKERVHPGMPTKVRDARIALVDSPIEVKSTETDSKIQITDPSQIQAFLDQEEKILKDMVDKIVNAGANVVVCQKVRY
jgi:chaperonin GroEL (HSP60 family)